MQRVYNDFVDAQERRRYYSESYLEFCVLIFKSLSFVLIFYAKIVVSS